MHWYNNIVVFMQKCIVHNKFSLEISILKKLQLAFPQKNIVVNVIIIMLYIMIVPHKTTVFSRGIRGIRTMMSSIYLGQFVLYPALATMHILNHEFKPPYNFIIMLIKIYGDYLQLWIVITLHKTKFYHIHFLST